MNRRTLIVLAVANALSMSLLSYAQDPSESRIKAVVFDGFPLFDPRPLTARLEVLFPGRGAEITSAWRARHFEYQWLRSLGGRYEDFLQTAVESLRFVATQLKLSATAETLASITNMYSELTVWPDVAAGVAALRRKGVRLAVLSNMTSAMLQGGLRRAGLNDEFEAIMSTDSIRLFKPDPRAYRFASDQLRLDKQEILFVAFAGWDVAGAKWFGYPTFWLNRVAAPEEELDVKADKAGRDMGDLVAYVSAQSTAR